MELVFMGTSQEYQNPSPTPKQTQTKAPRSPNPHFPEAPPVSLVVLFTLVPLSFPPKGNLKVYLCNFRELSLTLRDTCPSTRNLNLQSMAVVAESKGLRSCSQHTGHSGGKQDNEEIRNEAGQGLLTARWDTEHS